MKNVPSLNLYLNEKTKQKLKDIAEKENRSPSKQVKHMLEFYLQKRPMRLHELFDDKDKVK